MLLLLSGEGPTDIGRCGMPVHECDGGVFEVGPMAMLADQVIEGILNYSVIKDTPAHLRFITKQRLSAEIKQQRTNKRAVALTGKKQAQETGYFMRMTWAYGTLARQIEATEDNPAIAVFFRDTDGTHSTESGIWAEKWQSIERGFERAGFDRGVPMLPKPTSEAWLLCAAKNDAYQNCSALEELPGNLESARHPKRVLTSVFGCEKSRVALCEWLEEHPFDSDRVMQMGSYAAFHERLVDVVRMVSGVRA